MELSAHIRCLKCGYRRVPREATECPACGVDLRHQYRGLLPPKMRIGGHYVIDYVLGAGGFGVTYQAMDTALQRPVAIKEYFPRIWSRRCRTGDIEVLPGHEQNYERSLLHFESEGKILANLSHSGVVKVYSLFRAHNTCYLVMELLQGLTLREILQRRTALSKEQVADLVEALVAALGTLHGQGILHLDLKPENIMITKDRRVVLIDFGAARWNETEEDVERARTIAALTQDYAPIELLDGCRARTSPATDIYALSVVVYEMLVGRRPPSVTERLENNWQPGKEVPPEWLPLLEEGLALSPKERPATVEAWWSLYHRPLSSRWRHWRQRAWEKVRPYWAYWRWVAGGSAACLALWLLLTQVLFGAQWQYQQARRAYQQGEYPKAVELYNRLVRHHPQWGEVWAGRASAYLALGRFEEAIQDYRQALELYPEDHQLRQQLAQAYLEWAKALIQQGVQDHWGTIRRALQEAVQLHPRLASTAERLIIEAHLGLANYRLQQEDEAGAIDAYRQLLQKHTLQESFRRELYPQLALVYHRLAQKQMERGEWELALKTIQEGLNIDQTAGVLYFARGQIWAQRRQWARALENYNQAIAFLPEGEQRRLARVQRAFVLLQQNQPKQALEEYNDLLKSGFLREEVLNGRGLILFQQKNYTRALADFDAAIKINPNYVQAYLNRGWTKWHLKDYTGAALDFQKALDLSPDKPLASAYHGLGYVKTKIEPNAARPLLEKAIEIYRQEGRLDKVKEIQDWVTVHRLGHQRS